ncbi:hypothetical protein [Microbulbifer marinus]|uniref:Uncharacterized protein n=1 Tax=Microbulbifer marinus TaxID=658218 RepID=A0A1H3W7I9_9GAMM|nr:hypothetical protein [Microbulbifer marinus]SDZ82960.1 hypothetical protein SAMN05216562_0612 [Microbulbifer marinus]
MQIDRVHFLTEVDARLARMFSANRCGYRTPAVERHRLEGFMQAGVFLGLSNNLELAELMEESHQAIFGKSIRDRRQENTLNWRYEQVDYSAFEEPTYTRKTRSR